MTTYAYFVRGAQHAAMCRTSIESVRKVDQSAQCIVVTDELPAMRDWALDAAIIYIDPDMPIMLANLEAQVTALFSAHPDSPVVFLDTDILLLEKLPSIGDLTITWRDHVKVDDGEKVEGIAAQMPYNYGVIIARPSMAAAEAFIWMRERIRRMHERHQNWYGNQLALAELAGRRPEQGDCTEIRKIPWMLTNQGNSISIGKIPCERYNYTPQTAVESLEGRSVLHFKGGSRWLMEVYAKRLGLGWYLEPAHAAA